ncbi:MAG: hypothetical protein QOK04_183 [Solirubrobacteraceae bacterium]|jgi:diguanylate cyclase (GGDEF)-like protein|nr:hypothetical protein [Solirubrobacteraceae bacterium]
MDGQGNLATVLAAPVALLLALGIAGPALGKDGRAAGRDQRAAASRNAAPGASARDGHGRGHGRGARNGDGSARGQAPGSGGGKDQGREGGGRDDTQAGNQRRGGGRGEHAGDRREGRDPWRGGKLGEPGGHRRQQDDGAPLAGTASTGKTSQSGGTVAGPSASVAAPVTSGESTGGSSESPSSGDSSATAPGPPGAGALPTVDVSPPLSSTPSAVVLPSSPLPAPSRGTAGPRLTPNSPSRRATTLQRLLAGAGGGSGLAPLVSAAATPTASRSAQRSTRTAAPAKRSPTNTSSGPAKEIRRIVERVPGIVWVALAALGGLALTLVPLALVSTARLRRRGRQVEQLESVAATDALTGLLNRGALERGLRAELGRARRYRRPLSLVYFDVNGLKAINDLHGHATGDRLLKSIAQLFTETSRDHDLCGRMGGDECVVVLTEQDAAGAAIYGERVLERLPEQRRQLGLATQWGLTAGIASFPQDGDTAEQLLAAADERLYLQRGIRIEPRSA